MFEQLEDLLGSVKVNYTRTSTIEGALHALRGAVEAMDPGRVTAAPGDVVGTLIHNEVRGSCFPFWFVGRGG